MIAKKINTAIINSLMLIKYAIVPAAVNAIKAVPNHPAITFNTPATLYTALSLPHALSESDVPIATIKVT